MSAVLKEEIATSKLGEFWDGRYRAEGKIWGEEPSPTAELLIDRIHRTSASIVEIGFGYGRDTLAFCRAGHNVDGYELSVEGLNIAYSLLGSHIQFGGRSHLMIGDFNSGRVPIGEYDAVYSHRTLHLMGNNGLVSAFARHAAKVIKPGGLLVISARDTRDFDKDQMIERPDGLTEYKPDVPGRQGQLISLWNEARFRQVFERKFNILEFQQEEEPEALNNPGKTAKFTIMVAERRPL